MREYTEPTPIDVQSFSAGRILKESWEISTRYFGALVMPMFLLMIPGVVIEVAAESKLIETLGNLVSGLLMPIASMGILRSVIMLKREGHGPVMGSTFDQGCAYWWSGIRIGIVTGLYFITLCFAIVALILPGSLLMRSSEFAGGLLLTVGILASIWLAIWFASRACLALPAMADSPESAFKSFDAGWKICKQNIQHTRKLFLFIILIGVLFAVVAGCVLIVPFAIANAGGEGATGILAAIFILPGLLLHAGWLSFFYVAFCLCYLNLKPAPAVPQA
jgi:membrane-anchored glycerophosphoryl diester phosphodiesterase (GDPDase)